jgi:hypothetical protein
MAGRRTGRESGDKAGKSPWNLAPRSLILKTASVP